MGQTRIALSTIALLTCVILTGCGSSQKLTGRWVADSAPGEFTGGLLELTRDGTFSLSMAGDDGESVTIIGKWEQGDRHLLKLTYGEPPQQTKLLAHASQDFQRMAVAEASGTEGAGLVFVREGARTGGGGKKPMSGPKLEDGPAGR
jgi:hypothetical protein